MRDFAIEMCPLDLGDAPKILVRSTNWIGDAVMATPALTALRSAFPKAEIVLAASPAVSEVMANHPCCDRIIIHDKKGMHRGLRGLFRFSSQIASEGFDLAVLFQYAIEAALVARLARIRRRVGFGTDGRGLLLTHSVPVNADVLRIHHAKRYQYMLEMLGIPAPDSRLSLCCTDKESDWASQSLGSGRWVALNPGAAFGSAKRWYPDRFAAVADSLHADHGFRILLVGGPGEMQIGAEIVAAMRSEALNMIGKTSVRQMMALLSQVHLVITNDSGPMHVAAAFDRPIIALFGPTDHETTSPACTNYRIVRKETGCAPCLKRKCPGDHGCMADITVDDVLTAVSDILDAVK
ncbi:MAG: lipopolysaccharide heptosyltransferase II [Syntrophobacteraceae bacterium]